MNTLSKGLRMLTLGLLGLILVPMSALAQDGLKKGAEKRSEGAAKKVVYQNGYGTVVQSSDTFIEGAIVDEVLLHCPASREDTERKIDRIATLVRYPQAEATVVICHGVGCDRHIGGLLRQLFPGQKVNFLTFDFRAHGDNIAGQQCTFGRDEAMDVLTAAHFIKNNPAISELPIIAYGFSMGAAAAIEAQATKPVFSAMVLDCPFDSSERMLHRAIDGITFSVCGYEFKLPGNELLKKYAFHPYVQTCLTALLRTFTNLDYKDINFNICPVSPMESIKKITVPCFFIYCKNDEKIAFEAVKAVYDNAAGYKKLWVTNGRKHCDSFFYSPERYSANLNDFISAALDGELETNIDDGIIEDMQEAQTPVLSSR